ncbi:MAG: 30S ribosomal protein S20 [Myxococcota bacterium]|nr:30S ribosomal protein S20 [Myxococcota bacterium]
MANHKSALKRIRQSARRQKHNQHIRSGMRTEIKLFRQAVEAGDAAGASERFASVERAIRRASTKGLIPKRRADRSVGRLAKSLNALGS